MSKIKNCFMDEQPDFYYPAIINDVDYGTMRHLTAEDWSFLSRYANKKLITDKKGSPIEKDGRLQYEYDEIKLINGYLLCVFGGTDNAGNSRKLGEEGWNIDRDCTLENINLLKTEIKTALYDLVIKKQMEFANQKEAIEKN